MLDTIIIGSGPAGITAAIYASRANLSLEIIEKEYEGTGQIANTERVDNYPGLFGINGYELGESFRQHALNVGVSFCEAEVEKIKQSEDKTWHVVLSDGSEHVSKTVIYCGGAKHRKLGIPGEEAFYGRGVSYCALCDGAFYEGKTVAVVGGGNSAIEAAIYLANICEKVYLVHRREQFRAEQILVDSLADHKNIVPVLAVQTIEITGDANVDGLLLSDGNTLKVQGVFVEIGMEPNTEMIRQLGILDSAGYIEATEDCSTKLQGFFCAGDVRTKKLRQLVTAVSDGANAATQAAGYIRNA